MSKQAKNYLLIVAACFCFFLLAVNLLQIYELLESQRLSAQNAVIPSSALLWAFLEGLAGTFLFGYYFLSKRGQLSFRETFENRTRLWSALGTSFGGAVVCLAVLFFVPALMQNIRASISFPVLDESAIAEQRQRDEAAEEQEPIADAQDSSEDEKDQSKPAETEAADTEKENEETDKEEAKDQEKDKEEEKKNTLSDKYQALAVYTGEEALSGEDLVQSDKNSSIIILNDGASLSLSGSELEKTGERTDTKTFGINSALLLLKDTALTLRQSTVLTGADNSSAISAQKASIQAAGATLRTFQKDSPVLNLEGSQVYMNSSILSSSEQNSALVKGTDFECRLEDGALTSQAGNSPLFEGKGEVQLVSMLTSLYESLFCKMNPGSELYLKDSLFSFPGQGYEAVFSFEKGEDVSLIELSRNVLGIYDDYSYYNYYPASEVSMSEGMFSLDQARVVINLSGNVFAIVPETFLRMSQSECVMTTASQTINGNALVDSGSTLTMNLYGSSTYSGAINPQHQGKVIVNLSADSALVLTGDSYVDELNNENPTYSNIVTNGYTLYVNGQPLG